MDGTSRKVDADSFPFPPPVLPPLLASKPVVPISSIHIHFPSLIRLRDIMRYASAISSPLSWWSLPAHGFLAGQYFVIATVDDARLPSVIQR